MIRTNAHALNFLSSSQHERVIHFVMPEIQCPKCGALALGGRTTWGQSTPYCTVCGWNVERAKERERKALKQLPFAVLWFAFIVGIGGYSSSFKSGMGFIAIVFAGVLAAAAFRSWKKLKDLSRCEPHVKPATDLKLPSSSSPDALRNRIVYDRLIALGKPRRTKLKKSSFVLLAVFACIAGVALWTFAVGHQTNRPKANPGNTITDVAFFLIFGIISTAIVGGTLRSVFRDRRLLADGDIAIAVITSQGIAGGKSKTSRIKYDFKDAAGRVFSGKSYDESRELYEDMQTIVFYNRDNPSENVPVVGAMFKLVDS
jgi:hypothetical protein